MVFAIHQYESTIGIHVSPTSWTAQSLISALQKEGHPQTHYQHTGNTDSRRRASRPLADLTSIGTPSFMLCPRSHSTEKALERIPEPPGTAQPSSPLPTPSVVLCQKSSTPTDYNGWEGRGWGCKTTRMTSWGPEAQGQDEGSTCLVWGHIHSPSGPLSAPGRFLDGTFDPCVKMVSRGQEKALNILWSNSVNRTNV